MRISIAIITLLVFLYPNAVFGLTDEYYDPVNTCNHSYLCSCTGSNDLESINQDFTGIESVGLCQTECNDWLATIDGADISTATYALTCKNYQNQLLDLGSGSLSVAIEQAVAPVRDPIFPQLNVIIPGLGYAIKDGKPFWSEAKIKNVNGLQASNLLGTYIAAIYGYALIAGSIVAVTMLMVAGLQYATARGDSKHVENAKKRIGNAVAGIILLLLAYNIAFFIDPATTNFESLSFKHIEGIQLNADTVDNEGKASIYGATGTWENLSNPYKQIVEMALRDGACQVTDGLGSPTGTLPNQGNHHWFDGGANGKFNKINALDWSAAWGTDIRAPFAGAVSYETGDENEDRCGNRIHIKAGTGDQITICHVKDFLNGNNEYVPGQVQQGDVIGHVGGQCCAGESVPADWITECSVSGSACDPTKASGCACQTIKQAGNSSGPHVHISWSAGASNILTCLAQADETSEE